MLLVGYEKKSLFTRTTYITVGQDGNLIGFLSYDQVEVW